MVPIILKSLSRPNGARAISETPLVDFIVWLITPEW